MASLYCLRSFVWDLRYGARQLRRSPGFSAIAIVVLATGIGANLTIYAFAHALLVSPPGGVADPSRLVRAFTGNFSDTEYSVYEAYRDRNSTFMSLAAFRSESVNLRTDGSPQQRFAIAVTGNYFSALGATRHETRAHRAFLELVDRSRARSATKKASPRARRTTERY